MCATQKFPGAMQIEKRDYLIHYAIQGNGVDGYNSGNESCRVLATKQIDGFQPVRPSMQQQSYRTRIVAWNYQMDVIHYIDSMIHSTKMFGNRVQHKLYFQAKYPNQITDWDKQLR